MKKEILSLIREKLLNITDIEKQVDVMEYFICLSEFSKNVGSLPWLSSKIPSCYYDLTIADFVSLSDDEISKIVGKDSSVVSNECLVGRKMLENEYSVGKCCYNMANQCEIMRDLDLPNNDELFANFALRYMSKNTQLFNAGIALFHDDKDMQEVAKQYTNKRN